MRLHAPLFVVDSIDGPRIVGEGVNPEKWGEIGGPRELLGNNVDRGDKKTEISGIAPPGFATIPREIADTRSARWLECVPHRENPKKGTPGFMRAYLKAHRPYFGLFTIWAVWAG